MIQLSNIDVTLGKGTQLQCQLFKNLSFNVPSGEFVMVVGGNGVGKSSLFNVLTGALKVDSGSLKINQKDATSWPAHSRAKYVAKVMQDPRVATMDHMTLEENLSFAYLRGESRGLLPFRRPSRLAYFQEKLALLNMGLEHRLQEPTSHLSGGQRQALSLIMAILRQSDILLLDEITAALDTKTAQRIMELTDQIIRQEKRTTLMITHNLHHALDYGDRTIILSEGIIAYDFSGNMRRNLTTSNLIEVIEG
ncbi:MAG: ABC transporter ATP-binding protein [Janthinobacterium lividum]